MNIKIYWSKVLHLLTRDKIVMDSSTLSILHDLFYQHQTVHLCISYRIWKGFSIFNYAQSLRITVNIFLKISTNHCIVKDKSKNTAENNFSIMVIKLIIWKLLNKNSNPILSRGGWPNSQYLKEITYNYTMAGLL